MLMFSGYFHAFKNHRNWRSVTKALQMNVKNQILQTYRQNQLFFVACSAKRREKKPNACHQIDEHKYVNRMRKKSAKHPVECDSWFIYRRCCDFEGSSTEILIVPSISSSLRLYGERSISLHHFYWFGLSLFMGVLIHSRSLSFLVVVYPLRSLLVSTLIQ